MKRVFFYYVIFGAMLLNGCNTQTKVRSRDEVGSLPKDDRCEISMQVFDEVTTLTYEIKDREEMQRLILDPLKNAIADKSGARYQILGHLKIIKDNEEQHILLFIPLGPIKVGGQYLIADFSLLRSELEEWFEYLESAVFVDR
jgi:hypothetical protein